MNQALIDSIRKDLDALHANDNVKPVYAPFETLGADMVSRLPSVQGEILVISDAGLLVSVLQRLRRERLPFSKVQFLCHTELLQNFGSQLGVRTTLVCYNQLNDWFKKADMGMKFDVVVGNPPYQETTEKGNAGSRNLWSKFISLSERVCHGGGHIVMVTPSSWLAGGKFTPKVFKTKEVLSVNLDCGKYFDVGSTFSWYLIENVPKSMETEFTVNGENFHLDIAKFKFLPAKVTKTEVSILKKVVLSGHEPLGITWEPENIPSGGMFATAGTISESRTDTHHIQLLHTNSKRLWTNVPITHNKKKKVMFSMSGTFKPFYDDGVLGCTQVAFYQEVSNREDGMKFMSYFYSKLYRFIINHSCKYSGFLSETVFSSMPKLEQRMWTDEQLYDYFYLSQEERDLIERTVK